MRLVEVYKHCMTSKSGYKVCYKFKFNQDFQLKSKLFLNVNILAKPSTTQKKEIILFKYHQTSSVFLRQRLLPRCFQTKLRPSSVLSDRNKFLGSPKMMIISEDTKSHPQVQEQSKTLNSCFRMIVFLVLKLYFYS